MATNDELKNYFFIADSDEAKAAVDTYLNTYSPRVRHATDKLYNGFRCVHNTSDDTYISQQCEMLKESDYSHELTPVSTMVTLKIFYAFRKRKSDSARSRKIEEAHVSPDDAEKFIRIGVLNDNHSLKEWQYAYPEDLETLDNTSAAAFSPIELDDGSRAFISINYGCIPCANIDGVGYHYSLNLTPEEIRNADLLPENAMFLMERAGDTLLRNQNDLIQLRVMPPADAVGDGIDGDLCNRHLKYNIPREWVTENPDLFIQCPHCGSVFLKCQEKYVMPMGPDTACIMCKNSRIYSYHEWDGNYAPVFADGEEPTDEYFGIENETVGPNRNAVLAYLADNHAHWERDGSLGDHGMELILDPMSYKAIMGEPGDKYCQLLKALMDHGQKAHDTNRCGMHIHINHKAFVDEQSELEFQALINHPNFLRNNEMFARRSSGAYYRYDTRFASGNDGNFTWNDVRHIDTDGHGCAVNTRNASVVSASWKNTIEVRIFRATLNGNTVRATIQFIHNLLAVCNRHQAVVTYRELMQGDCIEQYLAERKKYGAVINMDAKVSFAYANMNDAFTNLCAGRATIDDFVKEYSRMTGADGCDASAPAEPVEEPESQPEDELSETSNGTDLPFGTELPFAV